MSPSRLDLLTQARNIAEVERMARSSSVSPLSRLDTFSIDVTSMLMSTTSRYSSGCRNAAGTQRSWRTGDTGCRCGGSRWRGRV